MRNDNVPPFAPLDTMPAAPLSGLILDAHDHALDAAIEVGRDANDPLVPVEVFAATLARKSWWSRVHTNAVFVLAGRVQ